MLKPQHLFAATLFFLFIYLFGYSSFSKYLRKDTIVIEKVKKTSNNPAPAITVVPYWKYKLDPFDDRNNSCWFGDIYNCLEEKYTHPLKEILVNASAFNWTSRFEPFGSLLFTLTSGSPHLSSKVIEALMVLVKLDTWRTISLGGIDMPDPEALPSFYLHDRRYFTYTTNPRFMS